MELILMENLMQIYPLVQINLIFLLYFQVLKQKIIKQELFLQI